jgi:ATP-dependent phosphofructokinase / diphosphate-dependent phosphofructokinase
MSNTSIRRIAISTGGGDAPGLNAVIRAVVLSALNRGWSCYGIRDGYLGILEPELYPEGSFIPLTEKSVRGITHLGGTIIGTTNRGNPLKYPVQQPDGTSIGVDRSDEIVSWLRDNSIDALIAVGGDGSLAIAHELSLKGVSVVGIPKTIDNDLEKTVITFGFDTAVSFATLCLDRLHSTAEAHRRVMVVEVMGRYAGWIALNGGIAGTADVILIPEIPYDITKVVAKIKEREKKKRSFSIVVVAEGAHPSGGSVSVVENVTGRAERLGGVGERVAHEIQTLTGKETRLVVLGHLLRGGSPTQFDRLLSLRFGAAAIRALSEGKTDVMVALDPPYVRYVPLEQVSRRIKTVPLNSDTILTGRDLGISFGD